MYRHSRIVRVTHWLNALCVFALLLSGFGITQLYAPLHWGDAGQDWGAIGQEVNGNSENLYPIIARAPAIPSSYGSYLRTPMRVRDHIAFAWLFLFNGLVYLAAAILTGRFLGILRPAWSELSWQAFGRELRNHVRLRFPRGDAARSYNLLQKYAYLFIIFGALPLQLLTGLALLPWMDGAAPWLKDLLGGRQSARTIHFFCALSILVFVIAHVAMVMLSGFRNNMRSMITGRYELPR